MAKEDNERYREQMKTFYKDELALMCLGHNVNDVDDATIDDADPAKQLGESSGILSAQVSSAMAVDNLDQKYPAAAAAATHSSSESRQGMNTVQAQQQQAPMGLMNPGTTISGQSPLVTGQGQMAQLASHQAGAVAGVLNPLQKALNLQNMLGGVASVDATRSTTGSTEQKAAGATGSANDDQIFQLLLQHQQSLPVTSPDGRRVPNETIVALILTQKSSLQQRQQKLTEELKTTQLKVTLLDKMLASEMSAVPDQVSQTHNVAPSAPISAPSLSNMGAEQLLQALQQQQLQQQQQQQQQRPVAPAANSSMASLAQRLTPPDALAARSNAFGGAAPAFAAGNAPVQDLLGRSAHAQPSALSFLQADTAQPAPANGATNQGNAGMTMEEMFMKQFMDRGK